MSVAGAGAGSEAWRAWEGMWAGVTGARSSCANSAAEAGAGANSSAEAVTTGTGIGSPVLGTARISWMP